MRTLSSLLAANVHRDANNRQKNATTGRDNAKDHALLVQQIRSILGNSDDGVTANIEGGVEIGVGGGGDSGGGGGGGGGGGDIVSAASAAKRSSDNNDLRTFGVDWATARCV
jgi:hypothetical protein